MEISSHLLFAPNILAANSCLHQCHDWYNHILKYIDTYVRMYLCNICTYVAKPCIKCLCQGRQADQRNKVVHKPPQHTCSYQYSTLAGTNTAHLQVPIQHTCNQVINDSSPFQLTDHTNFLSPTTSATENNGAIVQLPSHDTS